MGPPAFSNEGQSLDIKRVTTCPLARGCQSGHHCGIWICNQVDTKHGQVEPPEVGVLWYCCKLSAHFVVASPWVETGFTEASASASLKLLP